MGAGSVARGASAPSWSLAPDCAAATQGLVVSAFPHLASARALFVKLPPGVGGTWLAALRGVIAITDATGPASPSAAIAFTYGGLAKMGLGAEALASFSQPFREGMQQPDRARRLKDVGESVIAGGPLWGGEPQSVTRPGAPEVTTTPVSVDALLLLYAVDNDAVGQLCGDVVAALAAKGVEVVRDIALSLRLDANGISREHFGFADGISQPSPFGPEILAANGAAAARDPWHAIQPGDLLFGHINAHGEPAPGPFVKAAAGSATSLPTDGAPVGLRDLGVNGSYLVVRELIQDVAAFWTSMDRATSVMADPDADAEWLAGRIIGRTLDGDPLSPGTPLGPVDGQPANAFGFFARDPHGFGCPLGSHIRRANPRDGLARDAAVGPSLLIAANNHRILRRGRKFGPEIADRRVDDGQRRGLLFMALNTDLARQFEFVQQTWLLNQTFAVLLDETDPLVGPAGPFTVPGTPVRRRVGVDTFVKFAGGEYFFLPSLPALEYLATLT